MQTGTDLREKYYIYHVDRGPHTRDGNFHPCSLRGESSRPAELRTILPSVDVYLEISTDTTGFLDLRRGIVAEVKLGSVNQGIDQSCTTSSTQQHLSLE